MDKMLPSELLVPNPWLLYWQGTSQSLSAPSHSQALLATAYRRFRAGDDLLGMALSWSGLMDAILGIHTDFSQLEPWISEFNQRLEHRLDALPEGLRGHVAVTFFIALSFRQPLHADMPIWLARVHRTLACEPDIEERAQLRTIW